MTVFVYSARRVEECEAAKVAEARATCGVVEIPCAHCKATLIAMKPTYEQGLAMAKGLGLELIVACLKCASLDMDAAALRAASEVSQATNEPVLVVETGPGGKGGDA